MTTHNLPNVTTRRSFLRRAAALVSISTLATVGLVACGNQKADTDSAAAPTVNSESAEITVVASTQVWADVAAAVLAGTNAEVTAIVSGENVDPHSFEPAAADIAKAKEADFVMATGGGYDAWLTTAVDRDKLLSALPVPGVKGDEGTWTEGEHEHDKDATSSTEAAHDEHDHEDAATETDEHDHDHGTEVTESEEADHDHEHKHATEEATTEEHAHDHDHEHHHVHGEGEPNEHVWYNPDAVIAQAEALAAAVKAKYPNLEMHPEAVVKRMESIESALAGLPVTNVAQTEPIADYLIEFSALNDVTPAGYRAITLAEQEPSAADTVAFVDALKNGSVQVLIFNPQVTDDNVQKIRQTAEESGVTIVEIAENPPASTNFFDYYDQVVDHLKAVTG